MTPARRAGVVLLTMALIVGVVLAAMRLSDDDASRPPRARPAAAPGARTSPGPARQPAVLPSGDYLAAGRCREAYAGSPPVIPRLATQYDVAAAALALAAPGFVVVLAAPTHLGVVALVDGDLAAARRALPRVSHVVPLTPRLRVLADPDQQLLATVATLLAPAVRDLERVTARLGGGRAIVPWVAGGSIVVGWSSPVPARIRALAGERADGVRVIVEEGGYSASRMQGAVHRAVRALRRIGVRGPIDGFPCLDGSGIQLSVEAGRSRSEIERVVGRVVAMPVDVFVQPHGPAAPSR
jgi:hypothetical protein